MSAAAARAVVVGVLCCGLSAAGPARAAVYGDDDRQEPSAAGEPWTSLAHNSVVMMLKDTEWAWCGDSMDLAEGGPTVGSSKELCAGEPFADQPVLGHCSATLLTPNLVILAAHCLDDDATCENTLFARAAYYEADGTLHLPAFDEVARCAGVVAQPPGEDVVVVALQNAIGTTSVALAPELPAVGDEVATIGFPSGAPAKVATCTLRGYKPDDGSDVKATAHDCDTFRGNSGGGMFDAQGRLFGVISHGAGDYKPNPDDATCNIRTVYAQDGTLPGITDVPQLSDSAVILRALTACDGGIVDDVCVSSTTPTANASCGDGICDVAGERTCAADCSFASCPVDDGDNALPPNDDGFGCNAGAQAPLWLVGLVLLRRRRRR